jgi:hypothetical protein
MSTGGQAVLETETGREEFALPEVRHVGMPLEQAIVDELLNRGSCPSTLGTAMRSLQICCEMRGACSHVPLR